MKFKVKNYILLKKLISPGDKVLIGLSGGPDSVFLFHVLLQLSKEMDFSIGCAHLDHQWREDSHIDLNFSKNLCLRYSIPFYFGYASDFKVEKDCGGSKENYARELRREFYKKITSDYGYDLVALGHHFDDQIETFFIRLIRGATVSGLSCMRPKSANTIRPLLEIGKQEIYEYLKNNNLDYVIDSTNVSRDYLRNRIRLDIVQQFDLIDSRFRLNFSRSLENISQASNFIENYISTVFDDLLIGVNKLGFSIINKEKFLNLDLYIKKGIVSFWFLRDGLKFNLSENFIKEAVRFIENSGSLRHNICQSWSIVKDKYTISIQERLIP